MKLRRKNPCKECPFRKNSMPGWLGPWDSQGIMRQAHSEGGLACHMDVEKKEGLSDEELADKAHVCVGSLKNANKSHKVYRNPELAKMADAVGTDDSILNLHEFYQHHDPELVESFKKKKKTRG